MWLTHTHTLTHRRDEERMVMFMCVYSNVQCSTTSQQFVAGVVLATLLLSVHKIGSALFHYCGPSAYLCFECARLNGGMFVLANC